jgi:hypothetical protein
LSDQPAEGETLSARRLNRALLARQHLLEPSTGSLAETIEDVGGLQTQYAPAAYVGLFSRMASLERAELTPAMERREVIHGTLMRVTIHSVSARDYWPMVAGIRRSRQEWVLRVSSGLRGIARIEPVVEAIREVFAGGPVRAKQLTTEVTARGFPREAIGWACLWVDIVRIPPSGTWERRANDLYELAERWLPPDSGVGGGATEEDGMRLLVQRYLGGFGPATVADLAGWAGVAPARLRPVLAKTDLRNFKDEMGRNLIDLPDLPIPAEDAPAPVRFLPQWDTTLLVNCRRTQILPEVYRPLIFSTKTPQSFPTFTVDGQVAGTWRYQDGRVITETFASLSSAQRRDVEGAAARMAEFFSD